jgi:DNA-binding MltR family transcriptional regulator
MTTQQNFEQGWRQVATEFHNKNDRSTAILGAAFLEAHLGQLLGSFFVENCSEETSLLKPDHPLGTFNARVDAAYCLGLISSMEHHDLTLIVQIQHQFSNQVYGAAFTDDGIRDKCFQLRIPREVQLPGETRVPRQLCVFATAMLTQHLAWRTAQAEKNRCQTPETLMLIDVDEE